MAIGPVAKYRPPAKNQGEDHTEYRARCSAAYEAYKKLKAMRAVELAAAKQEKLKLQRTCQICGRDIFAETGKIAHHGYRRPHHQGYQTASCFGARALPFEQSRERLGEYIAMLEAERDKYAALAERVKAETIPIRYHYRECWGVRYNRRQYDARMIFVDNREAFAWIHAMYLAHEHTAPNATVKTFEDIRDADAADYQAEADACERERFLQQARWNAWVQLEQPKGKK